MALLAVTIPATAGEVDRSRGWSLQAGFFNIDDVDFEVFGSEMQFVEVELVVAATQGVPHRRHIRLAGATRARRQREVDLVDAGLDRQLFEQLREAVAAALAMGAAFDEPEGNTEAAGEVIDQLR